MMMFLSHVFELDERSVKYFISSRRKRVIGSSWQDGSVASDCRRASDLSSVILQQLRALFLQRTGLVQSGAEKVPGDFC